jgi:hypothetical protein
MWVSMWVQIQQYLKSWGIKKVQITNCQYLAGRQPNLPPLLHCTSPLRSSPARLVSCRVLTTASLSSCSPPTTSPVLSCPVRLLYLQVFQLVNVRACMRASAGAPVTRDLPTHTPTFGGGLWAFGNVFRIRNVCFRPLPSSIRSSWSPSSRITSFLSVPIHLSLYYVHTRSALSSRFV